MSTEDPGVIRRLDEVVVNRIAAGEIIKRPANALKEMIENSLDAKSTTIQVTVKDGGLKFLQVIAPSSSSVCQSFLKPISPFIYKIQDNGTGIRKDDLAIICERFTTSKLNTFEDLSTIATYGFRGEALASISHVAHLTIQTKTRQSACAYRASYTDSRLNGAVKPAAGNQGTQITVEDLFYNVPQRRQALRSAADEMARISDVVSRYAVHNPHVSFALRKLGDTGAPVVRTVANATHRQNIACLYGTDVAKDLVEIQLDDAMLRAKAHGFVTNVNYASKKATLLLFINHRLVESAALKTALDQIYATYLPKGSHPFVYISLQIDAANVDVNVHPTKHEVHFLHEDEIIERVRAEVERTLLGNNEARKFYAQTLLPGASEPSTQPAAEANRTLSQLSQSTHPIVYDKNMVRTDSKEQKLEKFFGNATLLSATMSGVSMMCTADDTEQLIETSDDEDGNDTQQNNTTTKSGIRMSQQLPVPNTFRARKFNVLRKTTKLTSILRMRQRCEGKCDRELRRLLSELSFVGVVDRRRALIQHDTKMYLCDTERLSAELFYQMLLYDFENFGSIRLVGDGDGGLSIRELAAMALNSEESGWTEADGSMADLADSVHEIFVQKRAILSEYYGFEIDADGRLNRLPLLLDNHMPSMAHLPMYLLRLATEVNWDEEQPFFETFSRETAAYYAIIPVATTSSEDDTAESGEPAAQEGGGPLSWRWYVEHVLFPAIKDYLLPPKEFMHNRCLLQVANLANLYKVFERC